MKELVDLERVRLDFAERLREIAGLRSPSLVRAIATVPREHFVGPGPWQILSLSDLPRGYRLTPDADPRHLYDTVLVALDADRLLNNGEPAFLSRCLDTLDLAPGDRFLHIGCGVGYYTAIAAETVLPGGSVVGVGIDPQLAGRAKQNLATFAHTLTYGPGRSTGFLPSCAPASRAAPGRQARTVRGRHRAGGPTGGARRAARGAGQLLPAVQYRGPLEEQSGLNDVYTLVALPRAHRLFERWRDEAKRKAACTTGDVSGRAMADADLLDRAAAVVHKLVMKRGHDEARDLFRVQDGVALDLPAPAIADILRSDGIDPEHRLVANVLRDERYSGIVWREVRCGLVHEARVIRQGFDFGEDRAPYYFSEEDFDTRLVTYPLVIPAKFLLRTLRLCVDRFEAFCSERDVDPYSCFDIP